MNSWRGWWPAIGGGSWQGLTCPPNLWITVQITLGLWEFSFDFGLVPRFAYFLGTISSHWFQKVFKFHNINPLKSNDFCNGYLTFASRGAELLQTCTTPPQERLWSANPDAAHHPHTTTARWPPVHPENSPVRQWCHRGLHPGPAPYWPAAAQNEPLTGVPPAGLGRG